MAVKYQRYWDSDEKKYKYRQISGFDEPKKTTKEIYEDSLKTDYKGFTGSGTTSAKEKSLESKAKAAQKKTTTDWKKSRSGAQGQATTKSADTVQYHYDNLFAPKKPRTGVGTALSTGNDGINMLPGKGGCADSNGLYNNVNRQSDRLILDKILRDSELEKNTNIGYNKPQKEDNTTVVPFVSDKNDETVLKTTNLNEIRSKMKDGFDERREIDEWFRKNGDNLYKKEEYYEAWKDPIAGTIAYLASEKATNISEEKYGTFKDGTRQNALKHALWNALMTQSIGYNKASLFAHAHEVLPSSHEDIPDINGFAPYQNRQMDLFFNELGRRAYLDLKESMEAGGQKKEPAINELIDYIEKQIDLNIGKVLIR